jgi:hypothetical protein
MAVIHLLADSPTGHYLECDGCREKQPITLPMSVFELMARMLKFDAEHRNCITRPVTRCQFADSQDGTCQHDRNLTPECTHWACPLT